jgi:hypothetical protein
MEDWVQHWIGSGETIVTDAPIHLVHRTHDDELTLDKIEPLRVRISKQGKHNREYVGYYNYEDIENDNLELDIRYGKNKIQFTIPAGSKILDVTKEKDGLKRIAGSSRVNKKIAQKLFDDGYIAIKGYDYFGPPEYVVLNTGGFQKTNESILRAFIRELILL